MAIDTAANFIYSTVATPPSPATSGTSLVMTDDLSAIMAAVPFNMFVWPSEVGPLAGNAEIVRVIAISGATLTITRAQEGTSARSIMESDQIAEGPTAKFRNDLVAAIAAAATPPISAVTGLGTGVAAALALPDDGSDSSAIGFRGIPPVSISADLTFADSHNGKKIYHPSADTTARTWTFDFSALTDPAGFTVTLINDASAGAITIVFANGTGVLAGTGATGNRTLAANSIATITGMTTARAMANGSGLT